MQVLRPKASPKSHTLAERKPFTVPHKEIKISIFFNQNLTPASRAYAHCSTPSYRNPIDITLKPSATFSAPKGSFHATTYSYSSSCRAKDNTLSKILKFNLSTPSAKQRGITQPEDKSFNLKSNTEDVSQKYSKKSNLICKTNGLYNHSGVTTIRKEIEEKFHRTRLILKEEKKLQQYQKIQKVYENRYKPKITEKKI